jgi:dihydrolipoamide dehydrogenase
MADLKTNQKIAVVGGGPGGYAAAFLAADLGMTVTLIDNEINPGGVCLYRGCIPSKSLLHVAKLIEEAKHSTNWGISFQPPQIDLDRLRSFKEGVVKKLTGGLGQLSKQRKVTYIQGKANLVDSCTIRIEKTAGGEETLHFDKIILATGSRPAVIPAFNIGSPRVMDSTGALNLEDIPKRLLVVGGGYIGLEMGTVYAALGSKVTVVELTGSLLPGVDPDLVRPLYQRLKGQFANIHLDTKVTKVEEASKGIRATLEGPEVSEPQATFDKVLVSVGRRPNSRNLGLEKTGVQVDDKGFIKVDERRRTTVPHIYAIGDVAGEPMLAHKAMHEGKLAVEVICGEPAVWEPRCIPAVVFTDPEIAWAGLMENEAKKQNREVKVARFHWGASGRAVTLGRTDGVSKLVVDPETDRILGVGLTGPGAGELIAEGVLAIEMAATARDVALSIHPHPTLTETISEAAESLHGLATHLYKVKRAK